MAALFFAFLFIHCDFRLTSWDYLISAAVLYALCLIASQLRTWAEYGVGSFATLEPAASGSVKVTIPTTSPWAPGQHIFVRFLAAGLHSLTAHPFSICSLPLKADSLLRDVRRQTADMVMYIQPRGGFTARLAALARQKPGRKVRVLLDGPYGGMKDRGLDGFDKAVVIAGGSGAGFTLPIVENVLLGRKAAEKTAGRKTMLHIVLAVKTEEERRWYEQALRAMLKRSGPLECCCSASIYVTGSTRAPSTDSEQETERSASDETATEKEEPEPLDDVNVFRGSRPDLPEHIRDAVDEMKGKRLGIAVCGPRSMLFDVRNAASEAQLPLIKGQGGEVYLYAEHFGW
jgi:Ferric reductase NAD binding domain/FAD-binding domain